MENLSHAVEHSIVHADMHASHVRVVHRELVEETIADFHFLFPHEAVLTTPMGCCHVCVYTDSAPASLVAQRISEHLRAAEHRGS
jgi:hypothetical protein